MNNSGIGKDELGERLDTEIKFREKDAIRYRKIVHRNPDDRLYKRLLNDAEWRLKLAKDTKAERDRLREALESLRNEPLLDGTSFQEKADQALQGGNDAE